MRPRSLLRERAFTLTELLVVIAIIAGLIALLIPALGAVQESSRSARCKSNLHQLALAVDMYHTDNNRFPPGQFHGPFGEGPDSHAWSWQSRLLPYIEEGDLFNQGGVPTKTLRESGIADRQIALFLCPSDGDSNAGPRTDAGNLTGFAVGQSNYKAVSGANWGTDNSQHKTDIGTDWANDGVNGSRDGLEKGDGAMFRTDIFSPRGKRNVTDGLSKTFLIGEEVPRKDSWCSWPYANNAYSTCAIPPNVQPQPGGDYSPLWWPNVQSFRSHHPGGLHFAMADGAVHLIRDEIDLQTYRALATIAGNESVEVGEE